MRNDKDLGKTGVTVMSDLELCNGAKLPFDEEAGCFHAEFDWCGEKVEFAMYAPPESSNSVGALQYAFKTLYENQESWNDAMQEALSDSLGLFTDDIKAFELQLERIVIVFLTDVSLFRPNEACIRAHFEPMHNKVSGKAYILTGTIRDGFTQLTFESETEEGEEDDEDDTEYRELSNGDELAFSDDIGIFEGETVFNDAEVDVFVEVLRDRSGEDAAFDALEKILADSKKYDKEARSAFLEELKEDIDELIEESGEKNLTAEAFVKELPAAIIVVDGKGGFEISYEIELAESIFRFTASGTIKGGYEEVLLEDVTDEYDDIDGFWDTLGDGYPDDDEDDDSDGGDE